MVEVSLQIWQKCLNLKSPKENPLQKDDKVFKGKTCWVTCSHVYSLSSTKGKISLQQDNKMHDKAHYLNSTKGKVSS